MLVCSNCNQTQSEGKFCGSCGGALEASNQQSHQEATAASETAATTTVPQNERIAQVQNGLKDYGNYFTGLLKNPTDGLSTNDNHFLNSLITIVLYALTLSLSIYFLVNSLYSTYMGNFGGSLPFFAINSRLMFFTLLLLATALVSIVVMMKLAKSTATFKTIVSQFGSLAVPLTAVHAVAIIAGLAGAPVFTLVLTSSTLFLFLYIIPTILVYEHASAVDRTGQNVYLALGTVVLTSLIVYFFLNTFMMDFIVGLESMLYNSFPF
ncbi:hypothetical protein [Halalkalibacillus halophilus]|uniref:hypothetical protein n=1 Tax=Halalkalibacillus halophilus TaxID=392827 RepID=UPI000411AB43|nr:hypothetical protein [Halalkalibacillus halophilus]